jgi:hypothetical protein
MTTRRCVGSVSRAASPRRRAPHVHPRRTRPHDATQAGSAELEARGKGGVQLGRRSRLGLGVGEELLERGA